MDKLVAERRSGSNRFARSREVLLGAFQTVELIAVGGHNHDPYYQDEIGRLRHLYVRGSARRSGVEIALVQELFEHAETSFHSVRLRTDTREAADFYVALRFRPTQDETATHLRSLRRN